MAGDEVLRPADRGADDSDAEKYEVDVMCSNCGRRTQARPPKGVALDKVDCPRCGVAALKPQWA